MTKNEVLNILRNTACRYAELVVDVCSNGEVCYPKEKIIVSVLETQNPFDFCGKAYTTFDSIRDFREASVFGEEEARKLYSRYYFGEIYKLTPIY